MAVKIGETSISDIQLGTTQINKVYKGTDVVWEAEFFGIRGITTSSVSFQIGGYQSQPVYTANIVSDNGDGTYTFECREKFSNVRHLLDGNSSIIKVTLLSLPATITDIDSLFYNCLNLTEITEIVLHAPVVSIVGMIYGCRDLTSFPDLKGLVTAMCTDIRSSLSYATKLDIDVSGWNTEGITVQSNMGCFNGLGDFNSRIMHVTWGAGFFNTMVNITIPIFQMKDYDSCLSLLNSILSNRKSIPYGDIGSYWGSQEEFDEWDGTQVIALHDNIKDVINNNANLVALRDEAINRGWVIQ
jgi:hypothetical protein